MSSQNEYYDVQLFGNKWVAMYDPEQTLMGESFDTEEAAWEFVRANAAPQSNMPDGSERRAAIAAQQNSHKPTDTSGQDELRARIGQRLISRKWNPEHPAFAKEVKEIQALFAAHETQLLTDLLAEQYAVEYVIPVSAVERVIKELKGGV